MKIKEGFIVREVGGKTIAVATGQASKEFDFMITLNATGKFLFEQLMSEKTKEQLIDLLLDNFDVNVETATNDVENFIAKIKEANLFE